MPDSARLILTFFQLDASRRPSNAPIFVYVSKYINVNGRIILKQIFKEWDVGMDCINLAQDTDRWRTVVNAAMKL